jgi:hypothetical protein
MLNNRSLIGIFAKYSSYIALNGSNAITIGINALLILLAAKLGEGGDVAFIAMAYAAGAVLSNFVSAKSNELVIKYVYDDDDISLTVLKRCHLYDALSLLAYLVCATVVCEYYRSDLQDKFGEGLHLYAWITIWGLFIVKQTWLGLLTAMQKFLLLSKFSVCCSFLRLVTFAVTVYLTGDVILSYALAFIISELISLLLFGVFWRRFSSKLVTRGLPAFFWADTKRLFFASCLKVTDGRLDDVIIGIVATPVLGSVLIVFKKVISSSAFVVKPLSQIFMGKMSKSKHRDFSGTYITMMKVTSIFVVFQLILVLFCVTYKDYALDTLDYELPILNGLTLAVYLLAIGLRSSLWWVRPLALIFSTKFMFLYQLLIAVFFATAIVLANAGMSVSYYVYGQFVYFVLIFVLAALFFNNARKKALL